MGTKDKTSVQAAEEKLDIVLRRLESSRLRCYDVETSGLDWRRCHIVGHVFTFSPNPCDSYYLPFRHAGGENIGGQFGPQDKHGWDGKLHPAEIELLDRLDRQDTVVFGHNLAFDLKFAWRAGMRRFDARFEDTIVNAPLLNEWQPKFSLDYCCQVAGVEAKKVDIIKSHILQLFPEATDRDYMGHYWRLRGNDSTAVEYAEGDGTSTWQLRDWQMEQIQRPDERWQMESLERVWDVESRLIPVLARMTCMGIRIDEEQLHRAIADVEGRVEKLMAEFPDGFNARSPQNVEQWCRDHGHTDWPLTEKKQKPSFPEKWLETHKPGQMIVAVRKLSTLRDTFLLPMRDTHLWRGRVHSNYNQLRGDEFGTITGRLSCDSPNLQAATKHNEAIGRIHRSIFVPDEGYRWANADYKQIEPVLLAVYSRCRVLLDGYRADPPIDAHTSASAAANSKWSTMTPAERKKYRDDIGKRINQTIITGGGKGVLVSKYGVPADEVDKVWDDYFAAMPEIRQLQNSSSNRMRRRGYVASLLGRRARLRDPGKAYTATNRLLQCGNADIIKLKMVEIDEYLKSEGRPLDLINNVHDDLAFQFPEWARPHYTRCLEIMTDFGPDAAISLDVPLLVDAGEGASWAEATFGPEKKEK